VEPETLAGVALVVLGVVLAIKVVKIGLRLLFLGVVAASLYVWFRT